MARIPADLIRELRRRTGASIGDCRRALEAADGDLRQAARLLRLQALTAAARPPRLAGSNGVVAAHVLDDGSAGGLVEVAFETRRASRSERFQHFVATLARQVAEEPVATVEELLDRPWLGGATLKVVEELGDMILRAGESFGVRRFARLAVRRPGLVAGYAHGAGPVGRIGALVEVSGAEGEPVRRLARELTLQVVFDRPTYLRRSDVPPGRLEFERFAIRRRLLQEGGRGGSLDALAEEILRNSFFRSAVLEDQPWVRDVRRTVRDLVAEAGEECGAPLEIRRFVLLEVGAPVEEAASPGTSGPAP